MNLAKPAEPSVRGGTVISSPVRAAAVPTGPSGLSMESKPGEILIAGMRMCLLDVATSLFSLRKSLEAIIGPAVATIFYDAGFQGALKYAESIVAKNLIRADEAGFREA